MGEFWTVNSTASLENFIKNSEALYEKHKYVRFSWKTGRQRTDTQNAAIHVFCRLIAEGLNDAGLDRKVDSKVLGRKIEMNWTKESIKELFWRPIQFELYGKNSTKELERNEVSEVAEIITRYLSEKFGLSVIFPSRGEEE